MRSDPNVKQTSSTICVEEDDCFFHGLQQMYQIQIAFQMWGRKKIESKSSHRGSQVSVHKHWMLEWENSVQCLVNLDGPIELCCMSGLVAALVIFRSSLASLMGPWGPINSPRACVQDRKAPQILLRSLVLQRFPDKKFTRPPDYHRLTSPSAMWCRKGCHKECLQS